MGGWNSGRRGGLPTVEDGLRLDLALLMRQGYIRLGCRTSGSLAWRYVATEEERGSIRYEADWSDASSACVRLIYSVNGKPMDYRIWLERTPCNFGGFRWWWRCPRSGRRVRVLCLPPGETMFVARAMYRLPYRSQREAPIQRSHDRLGRLYRKLGGAYHYFEDPIPRRPKGMHRRTHERLAGAIEQAESSHDRIWLAGNAVLLRRLGWRRDI